MADFYARFTEVEAATVAKVAEAMEVRPPTRGIARCSTARPT